MWLTNSSSSPQSGHKASYISLRPFKLLKVGKKLFVILHRLIRTLLRIFRL
ncbi:hypothetical protein ES332_A11G168300v1 [Gossypium tomentosum]|uniref:Uncharacterized protein n=1 Tax=Gossypium tomentosum TaxID=34277 RepID=A0A5D2NC77_GOSTO|nr:hypothetical protein ES332_A11G168300v1 [Gossypium tomentosum]